jgi:hypothetical protein
MKTLFLLTSFCFLAVCRSVAQDTAGFRRTLDSVNITFLQHPLHGRIQSKLSRRDVSLYNSIIYNYFDTAVIYSNAAGESPEDIHSRIRSILHTYHFYIAQHPSPVIRMINVKDEEWKELTNSLGVYKDKTLWFLFKFNPLNNKIVWLSGIVNLIKDPLNNN